MRNPQPGDVRRAALDLAERVRAACIDSAMRAYDDAGVQGLCAEGRWEAAVGAMRSVAVQPLLASDDRRSPADIT